MFRIITCSSVLRVRGNFKYRELHLTIIVLLPLSPEGMIVAASTSRLGPLLAPGGQLQAHFAKVPQELLVV